MTINSYQDPNEKVQEAFTQYIQAIANDSPYIGSPDRGVHLNDYLATSEQNSWEGYSDAEITAIYHFLHDLDVYIHNV